MDQKTNIQIPHMETAVYRKQSVRHYEGNPLIEALPPIYSEEELIDLLSYYPDYLEEDRQAPTQDRLQMTKLATRFFQPLPIHIELGRMFDRMMRMGYGGKRNPLCTGFYRQINERIERLESSMDRREFIFTYPHGFTIIGISGIGKTRGVQNVLSLYPQVICHSVYQGKPLSKIQIPWLMLQCPHDGSTKALCKQFFTEMDKLLFTTYERDYAHRRASIDDMIRSMARLAELHSLGVLVVDEIQVLSHAKSGGKERMLDFFLQLVNEIGLPVVLIGTYRAYDLFSSNLRVGRRGTGEGNLIWPRMEQDDVWEEFLAGLWNYQYLHNNVPLTPQLSATLYDLSQGITDLAVKLYMFGQMRAILTATSPKDEYLTDDNLRSVAADSFQIINPILDGLRRNDTTVLRLIDDVNPPNFDQFLSGIPRRSPKKVTRQG